MRTIKFRGKDIKTGEWLYGNIQVPTPPFDKFFMWDNDHNQKEVVPDTVGQFTGRLDKYGKRIFEWDILKVFVTIKGDDDFEEEVFWRVGVIRFVGGAFVLTNCTNYADKELKTPHRWSPNKKGSCSYPAYRSEIIGNIHDNPELLKGGNDEK